MEYGIWTKIGLAALALVLLVFVAPGLKNALQQSQQAEKDWKGILIPIAFVVLFVIFLIISVR
ncbi:MAG: hypothetical protein L0Z73_05150 [Gammaproteobacteria bacterium]|nr:hypothetical protein [Gammaproteobacteria bacterium]